MRSLIVAFGQIFFFTFVIFVLLSPGLLEEYKWRLTQKSKKIELLENFITSYPDELFIFTVSESNLISE